ncbi:MAG: N-acetylmuramoyl-L-alanine amidase [Bacteroidales bacterium]
MKKIKHLIIHCTDTPYGRIVTVENIKEWHLAPRPKGNGWKQVGYTDLIGVDGTLTRLVENNEDEFVDPWEVTNGVRGFNAEARHIVLAGGKGNGKFGEPQFTTLASYIKVFLAKFSHVQVGGHYQFDNGKTCPNFNVPNWLRSIGIEEVNIYK